MEILIILIMVMVSWRYMYISIHQIVQFVYKVCQLCLNKTLLKSLAGLIKIKNKGTNQLPVSEIKEDIIIVPTDIK